MATAAGGWTASAPGDGTRALGDRPGAPSGPLAIGGVGWTGRRKFLFLRIVAAFVFRSVFVDNVEHVRLFLLRKFSADMLGEVRKLSVNHLFVAFDADPLGDARLGLFNYIC